MRRELKFRARVLAADEWVHGSYVEIPNPYVTQKRQGFILLSETEPQDVSVGKLLDTIQGFFRVDPDTVGQFTGLLDRDGKEIFEGDVVQTYYDDEIDKGDLGKIALNEKTGTIEVHSKRGQFPCHFYPFLEVIGNIYENSGLLENPNEA